MVGPARTALGAPAFFRHLPQPPTRHGGVGDFTTFRCPTCGWSVPLAISSFRCGAFRHLPRRLPAQAQEQLGALDEALGREDSALRLSPWEEVRDFFHYCDNYIDAVDRAAEHFAAQAGTGMDITEHAIATLARQKVTVRMVRGAPLRKYDPASGILEISAKANHATQAFQLLHQVALLTQSDLLDATLDLARFQSDESRAIAKNRAGQLLRGGGFATLPAFPVGGANLPS